MPGQVFHFAPTGEEADQSGTGQDSLPGGKGGWQPWDWNWGQEGWDEQDDWYQDDWSSYGDKAGRTSQNRRSGSHLIPTI